ncbi:MAG TPA: tRNA (adenosine(37)-N6)-threonylcarbamoyltransferase complex transferase subunit TsaD, partial [Armatimonadota bacterium]|nr:tRNA (adenosine(37)-N6)-threonylcarbamoyltransferase complex transferase subunit TsaD [Armatimonadota bacterium]
MNILGIETSCDETSAAVLSDGRDILSNVIASQTDLHAKFGGIVPEIASRKHVEVLNAVIQEALDGAGVGFSDLNAVAVTNRPGLVGALLVGVSAAKAISAALSIPLIGVHHLEGHIYANFLANPEFGFPFVCLVVSGGHTDLIVVKGHGDYEI